MSEVRAPCTCDDADRTASLGGADMPTVNARSGRAPRHADEVELHLPLTDPDRYEVHGEVARGGLGRILRVRDRWLDRTIAIKELLRTGPDAERRFVREAMVTARLLHPAIIPVHEAGRWPTGQPFYTMKLISGRSLKEVIAETSTLDERLRLLPNVIVAADAVAYAHSQGVVHRDLKPANILVGPFGETVVIDWGLTKPLADAQTDVAHDDAPLQHATLTSPGGVVGTPAYMAPEQADGHAIDERADVYALGAVLYQLLSGKPPYSGAHAQAVLDELSTRGPEPLTTLEPGVPADLAAIVSRAMARDARDRYPSARALSDDLQRFVGGQLVAAHRYTLRLRLARWMARRRGMVLVAAVALLVLLVSTALSVHRVMREHEAVLRRKNELILLQAESALERDPTRALAWLKSYPRSGSDFRVAADIAADARSRGVARHVLQAHQGTVRFVAFRPDGRVLASIGDDQTLLLWDVPEARPIARLDGRQQSLGKAAFSPDGARVASAGVNGEISIWEPASQATQQLVGHEHLVLDLRFSRDGRSLVSAGSDGSVRLWDLGTTHAQVFREHTDAVEAADLTEDGQLVSCGRDGSVRRFGGEAGESELLGTHEGACEALTLSSDGSYVATAGTDGRVVLWPLSASRFEPRVFSMDAKASVSALALSHQNRWVAAGSDDGDMRVWDVSTGTLLLSRRHDAEVRDLTFSADDRFLASADFAGHVELHELGRDEITRFLGHGSRVYGVAFSPDGHTLASASNDKSVRLWDVHDARGDTRKGPTRDVYHAVYAPDGKLLASDGADRIVRVWDRSGKLLQRLAGHSDTVCSVVFAPDGRWLVSTGWDGTVRRWDLSNGQGEVLIELPGVVWHAAISADGKALAAADSRGSVWLWDLPSLERRELRGHDGDALQVEFATHGRTLASTGLDGTVRLWDVATGAQRKIDAHQGRVYRISFAPDGRSVASAGRDGSVKVWEVASLRGRELGRHEGPARDVAFTPDGRKVVSAGDDHVVRLLSVDGKDRIDWYGHDEVVRSLTVSPDGRTIASGSQDGTVRLWSLDHAGRDVLRGHAGYVLSVAFSPDGRELASAGAQGTVRVFEHRPSELVPDAPHTLPAWLARTTSFRLP